MSTVHEIADGIYRITTFAAYPELPEGGITFSFFHTGGRAFFPQTLEAIKKVVDLATLRYISWSHLEADECGALNDFLQVAPQAEPVCGLVGALLDVGDFFTRRDRR